MKNVEVDDQGLTSGTFWLGKGDADSPKHFPVQSIQFKCPFDHYEIEPCWHKNGTYQRYANANGDSKVTSQRLLCKFTGRTISILPDGMLPYWAVSVTEIEDHFDQKNAQNEDSTPSVEQAPERAWNRFCRGPRLQSLTDYFGQRLPLVGTPRALWQAIKRTGGTLHDILRELAHVGKSLLGDYRCLSPN